MPMRKDRARARSRRQRRAARELVVAMGPEPGPGVVVPTLDELVDAIEAVDPDLSWRYARHRVRPVLPRVRPYTLPQDDPIRMVLPPGILVGFGIDIGPAFVHVTERVRDGWGITIEQVAEQALSNVRERTRACRERVARESVADVPVQAFQSRDGWAGALLLVPDLLPHFFGERPYLLIVPMRDLLIALPDDVDPAFAGWLSDEFASADPNGLHLGGFRYDRGALIPVPLETAVEA